MLTDAQWTRTGSSRTRGGSWPTHTRPPVTAPAAGGSCCSDVRALLSRRREGRPTGL